MENKNNAFDEDLVNPVSGEEIEVDELAVYTAGLTHPDELELESILAEDWDSVPDHEEPAMTPEEALNQFLYGAEEDAVTSENEPTQVISIDTIMDDVKEDEYPSEAQGDELLEEAAAEEEMVESEAAEEAEELLPEEVTEEDVPSKPLPKRRPKMKKGYGLFGIPHIISTVIWLALIVAIGVSLGRVLWVCCADVMAFGKPQVTAYVDVKEDDDIQTIA